MRREVWTPGAPGPHDELVRNLHGQIARMGEGAAVSVELADGSLFQLISISPRPGFGFVTLQPHPEDEDPMEVVVPVASIAQIRIGRPDPQLRPGFALPREPPEGDATQ
jgi:hypothetical protein